MKFLVVFKICGKQHKTYVYANDKLDAVSKVRNSLGIIKIKPEDNPVDDLKEIFGLFK